MKLLLIIFGSLAAIMILIIIIASRIPSFEERRKNRSFQSSTPGAPKVKRNLWPIIAVILLALAIVVGVLVIKNYLNRPSVVSSVAADAQDIWVNEGGSVKVNIYPDYWSEWIILPPGAKVAIRAPGELEYLFWTGERVLVRDNESPWLGKVSSCKFRLRGTAGEATITVQATQNPVNY